MSTGRMLWRVRLITALLLAAPLLSACNQEDIDFIVEVGKAWAQEKGLIDSEGNPDYLNVGLLLANPASDPQAAAALEAGLVVKNLEDADRMAQQGAAEGDLAKIEVAIASRPSDWSYQEQKAALLLAQGDADGAAAASERSEGLVRERVRQGGDCRTLARNLLTHRLNALETQQQRADSVDLQAMVVVTQSELGLLRDGQPISLCP